LVEDGLLGTLGTKLARQGGERRGDIGHQRGPGSRRLDDPGRLQIDPERVFRTSFRPVPERQLMEAASDVESLAFIAI